MFGEFKVNNIGIAIVIERNLLRQRLEDLSLMFDLASDINNLHISQHGGSIPKLMTNRLDLIQRRVNEVNARLKEIEMI